jgi:hypothetical protein
MDEAEAGEYRFGVVDVTMEGTAFALCDRGKAPTGL